MEAFSVAWLICGPGKKPARLEPNVRSSSDYAVEIDKFSGLGLSFKRSAA